MKRIGFAGIGYMGAPMARNLLKAGFAVTVWNRTRAKAEPLAGEGATVAGSVAEVAENADVVITMVANGGVVDELLLEHGLAEALGPDTVFIDMSSVEPATARRHAELLAERGVASLDAPVSGGTLGAEAGALAIMVGGEERVFAKCRPVFEALGRPTLVGPSGAGQLVKLCNQVIVAVTIGAVSEALVLAKEGGADPAAVREALRGGFADSRILAEHGRRMVERDFEPGGVARNQLKDLRNALAAADECGLSLPVVSQVTALFEGFVEAHGGCELDHSALILEIERLNGLPSSSGDGA